MEGNSQQNQNKQAEYPHNARSIYYQSVQERDLLSSAYSSVASTILPDRQLKKKESSPSIRSSISKNQKYQLKHINKKAKGKGGKQIFPKDFFSG